MNIYYFIFNSYNISIEMNFGYFFECILRFWNSNRNINNHENGFFSVIIFIVQVDS